MLNSRLKPVVMPAEIVIFAGSQLADDIPRFPTEEEAWEYLEEIRIDEGVE